MVDKVQVSIITPLYKGGNYINRIINQVEKCKYEIDEAVELIFVNDYPDDFIEDISNDELQIKVINNKKNVGIHASRVGGLEEARGDYILFLDQDDYIYPEYLKSQLSCIGAADMTVCKLKNGNKQHYTESFKFSEVVTRDFLFNNWCSIVSPGQALIKKDAIPDIWKKKIVSNNGADDYFLWLLMFGMGKKVKLNDVILFEHRITGFNTSTNTNQMMDSEEEVIKILVESGLFGNDDIQKLNDLRTKLRKIHVKQLDNLVIAFSIRNILEKNESAVLNNILHGKVAIYGAADIGREIYIALIKKGFSPILIDRNADYIDDLPVIQKEQMPEGIDTLIVAINNKEVVDELSKEFKGSYKVYSINELIAILQED